MSRPLAGCLLAAALPLPALTPQAATAQYRHSWQLHALATFADADFLGGGAGFSVRAGSRMRLAATATGGSLEGELAGRGEVLALFVLNPYSRNTPGFYGGGGLAFIATRGALDQRLVLLVGMEHAPAAPGGWFVEIGVGGGLRGAVGVRLRTGRLER